MLSTKTKESIIEGLPSNAKTAHEFPTMKQNLLSVPLLCNANYITAFCKDKVLILKDNEKLNKCLKAEKPILEGKRDYSTNLWEIPVGTKTVESTPTQELTIARDMNNNQCKMKIAHTVNSAYQQRSAAELQAFLHGTLCAPRVSTLIKAIKTDWLSTFPGISVKGVQRHLPKSTITAMGHLDKYRKNTRSTRKEKIDELMAEDDDDEDDVQLEPPRKIKD